YSDPQLLDALRALCPEWRKLLASAGPQLRVWPAAEVWPAVEDAAHSRGITALHAIGVEQALQVDECRYTAFEEVLADTAARSYAYEEPSAVVDELEADANRAATLAESAGPDAWTRGLTIGDNRNDVRGLLEHALHDSTHHLDDVERGLNQS